MPRGQGNAKAIGTAIITGSYGGQSGTISTLVESSGGAFGAYSGGSGTVSPLALQFDDFTGYATTADLIADTPSGDGTATLNPKYQSIRNKSLLSLDTTVLYNGHPTAKYFQPENSGGSPQPATKYFPNGGRDNIWIRAKIRWSPGYTTVGTGVEATSGTASAAAYKILGWPWTNYEGRGTLDFSNTNQYQLSWYANDPGSSSGIGPFSILAAGSTVSEWTDGLWYDYIVNYANLSATLNRSRLWIAKDGEAPVLRATVDGTVTVTGKAQSQVAFVTVGMNFNQLRNPGQNQALWWGFWEVIDGVANPDPYGLGA